jgi:hypothetical protein
MARSNRLKCPPGVLCLSGGLGTTLLVILVIAGLFVIYTLYFMKPQTSTIIIPRDTPQPPSTTVIPIHAGGDSRYDRAPQPLRDWMMPPEFPPRGGIASIPINIPTKGLPESFQSVGLINVDGQVWPLYGRRTPSGGSDRWNYYTRTDTYNPVPIPIRYQKRDCMDDIGCPEILSGEDVKIEVLNKQGKTKMYRFDGPKYIPGLL